MQIEVGTFIRLGLTLSVTVAAVAACDKPGVDKQPHVMEGVTEIEEIEEETESFVGRTVHVIGEVDATYSDRAFELEGLDWLFNDDVLVVSRNPVAIRSLVMDTNDLVRVEGTVREFSKEKLESELGWQFDPDFVADWTERPVIRASKIEVVRRYASWDDNNEEPGVLTSPWTHDWTPEKLDQAGVDFERARVNEVGKSALWIGPDRPGVLVLPENPAVLKALDKGDVVQLRGVVKKASDLPELKKLSAQQQAALREQGVYISATALTKAELREGEQG